MHNVKILRDASNKCQNVSVKPTGKFQCIEKTWQYNKVQVSLFCKMKIF